MAAFQRQVLAAYRAGLKRARETVELYEGFAETADLGEKHRRFLDIALRFHRSEVKMYEKLILQARRGV